MNSLGGIAVMLQAMPEADREAVGLLIEQAAGDFRVDGGLAARVRH
jgi:hypothetical protein